MIIGGVFLAKVVFGYSGIPFPDGFFIYLIPIILCGRFNFWHKKPQGMNYLLNPANTVEKVIANILLIHVYSTVIVVLSCLLGFYMGNLISVHQTFTPLMVTMENLSIYDFIESLLPVQALFIFACIYFRKNALLKMVLLFVALIFVMIILVSILAIYTTFTDGNLVDELAGISYILMDTWVFHVFNWIIIVFFWVLSYFRLRETEV